MLYRHRRFTGASASILAPKLLYGRFRDIFGRRANVCLAMSVYMIEYLIAGNVVESMLYGPLHVVIGRFDSPSQLRECELSIGERARYVAT